MMTIPTTTPPSASPVEATAQHDALDEALVAIRRVLQRPGYRRRLLEGLPSRVELAVVRLLRTVQRSEGPPSIGDVADVLAVDPSTASRVVDRAVAAGHLDRRACTDDRRRARLHLTVSGAELLDHATRRRRELLSEITVDWSDEELEQLVGGLRRLLEGFDTLEGTA